MNNKPIEIISLGGGVQSSTLVLMNILGAIEPKAECAIFADTQYENQGTYDYLEMLIPFATKHNFPIYIVSKGSLKVETLSAEMNQYEHIPFFTASEGQKGQLRRQCTNHYKIYPIRKQIRKLYGKVSISQWLGFSLDEIARVAPSNVQYIQHRYPLLEKRMRRSDCIQWLKKNGFPLPPKSACVCCPYRTDSAWQSMKENNPDEFQDAVEFDKQVRELHYHKAKRKSYPLYLHRSCEPLDEVMFKNTNQLELFQQELAEQEDCSGGCWL